MNSKEFFINAVRMIDVEGNSNIPTALFYGPRGRVYVGSAALASVKTRQEINEDFKIDLGNINHNSTISKRTYTTASGEKKSALWLTSDFFYHLLQHCNRWLTDNEVANGASILLAEPLAMQTDFVDSDWLSNYRQNLRRLLIGKQLMAKNLENIDFLPEPFAVFQYY